MANRRMFSLDVVDTDNFLDMPASARLLYYDLGMRADDDGFLQSAQNILRFTGASGDDLDLLAERGFVIRFETGTVVIRHWRRNNQIRADRYKETLCAEEKRRLAVDGDVYRLAQPAADARLPVGCQTVASLEPTVANLEPQERLGEVRIDQRRKRRETAPAAPQPPAPAPAPTALLHAESDGNPEPAIDGSGLSADRERYDAVERLIKRYRMTDNDVTLSALLEDVEKCGLSAVEDALSRAAMSDTRGGISVRFYRAVLTGKGRDSPRGGFTRIPTAEEYAAGAGKDGFGWG